MEEVMRSSNDVTRCEPLDVKSAFGPGVRSTVY
jgi:hypothetical protein